MDGKYFSRAATWHVLDGHIVANDSRSPKAPRLITMDPWPELVFSAADGEHTVGELITSLASEYASGAPAGLREQVHEIVDELVEEGMLRLHDSPEKLPPYFAENYFDEPPDVRAAQMRADGLIS